MPAEPAAASNDLQERALEVAHKGWSIRHRLMLLALAVALPFVLLTGGIVWQLANNERETRREAILFSTRTLMNAVDTILSKQIAVAQMLATSPALQADDLATFRQEAERAMAGPVRRLDRAERRERPAAHQPAATRGRAIAAPAADRPRSCSAAPSKPAKSRSPMSSTEPCLHSTCGHRRGAGRPHGTSRRCASPSSWSPASS